MEKFKVEESTFFLFKNSRRNSSSTLKSSLATIHPMSIRSSLPPLSTVVPPTTKTPRALKESGTLVGTSMIIGVSLCSFFLREATDRFERDLTFGACSSPLRQWNSLVILHSTISISLILLSFFLRYTFLFARFEKENTYVPLNVFNISKKKKKIAKNLDNLEEVSLGGDIFEIWIWFIDRLGRVASIWEGRRCAQLSTNHRICCCGFRNTPPSSSTSSSSSCVNGGGRRRIKLDHDVTHNKLMAAKIK